MVLAGSLDGTNSKLKRSGGSQHQIPPAKQVMSGNPAHSQSTQIQQHHQQSRKSSGQEANNQIQMLLNQQHN